MKRISKPNRFVYWLACVIVSAFLRIFYRMRITRQGLEGLQQPFVAVANHISNMDFLITAIAMRPYRLHYVAAAYHFRNRSIRWLLKLMGCIRKEQFFSDYRSVRQMLAVAARGENIMIFPSGQSSFTGEGTYMGKGIAPLIKKLGLPVVQVLTHGGHIALPKWNMKKLRKSRIEAQANMLLSAEETQRLDNSEIYQKITTALHFDDYEWQRKARVKAKAPRCAEGLEKFLFRCPKCKAEFTMRSSGSRLYCEACANAAVMDEYGFLAPENGECSVFETPTQWNRWQFDEYRPLIEQADFVCSEPCKVLLVTEKGEYIETGAGTVELSIASLRFEGEVCGEAVKWKVDNGVSPIFPHEKEVSFDVMIDGELFSFAPSSAQKVYKFMLLKELIFRRYFEK